MLPAWLLWLLPVPLATAGAVAWSAWTGRARRPLDVEASLREHARFRAALAAPLPTSERPAPEG